MVSKILSDFGSLAFGTSKLHGIACIEAVSSALAAGYRIIDSAQSYNNEKAIGEAIQNSKLPREDVFVTTKISGGWLKNPSTYKEAYDSARASIRTLGLGYVDMIMIHAPGS